jgi:hypothetical protein
METLIAFDISDYPKNMMGTE